MNKKIQNNKKKKLIKTSVRKSFKINNCKKKLTNINKSNKTKITNNKYSIILTLNAEY